MLDRILLSKAMNVLVVAVILTVTVIFMSGYNQIECCLSSGSGSHGNQEDSSCQTKSDSCLEAKKRDCVSKCLRKHPPYNLTEPCVRIGLFVATAGEHAPLGLTFLPLDTRETLGKVTPCPQ